jgi:hypothetical protein
VCYVIRNGTTLTWEQAQASCNDFPNQARRHLAHPNNDPFMDWLQSKIATAVRLQN